MKLEKRNCPISVEIEPVGAGLLYVKFDFGNGVFKFTPSSSVGGQFGDFVCALYTLYSENINGRFDGHSEWNKRYYKTDDNHHIISITTTVEWDGEGPYLFIDMTKEIDSDIIKICMRDFSKTLAEYSVDGRDFCYAISKACTKVLKDFGFYGYKYSTEGEPIILYQLLFLKAYALGNKEARELFVVEEWLDCCKSDFEKEIELLLFDM